MTNIIGYSNIYNKINSPEMSVVNFSYTILDYNEIVKKFTGKQIELSPVIPISYANNKEYDELTKSINSLNNKDYDSINNRISHYNDYISYAVNNNNTNVFNYYNSIYSSYITNSENSNNTTYLNNNYILKFEDIVLHNNNYQIKLDENTNINDFINTANKAGIKPLIFGNITDYNGAFLYPDIDTLQQVQITDNNKDYNIIRPGESISIPITFEFYISYNNSNSSISKSLIFYIKDSKYNDPKYYEIEITGNNSLNNANSIYTSVDNFVLSDSLT